MIATAAPVDHGDYHTLDLEAPEWWARLVCFQSGDTCGAFLLQDHKSAVQGIYRGVYDHEKELVLGSLSGDSTVDLGAQIARATADQKPDFSVNVGMRKAIRLLQEGELDELIRKTCEERNMPSLAAGTDSKAYANLIRARLNRIGFKEQQRFSETGTRQYVWTKDIL